MKFRVLSLCLCFLIFTNCGFKVVNKNSNYNIAEINNTGDKKISFSLKNKLLFYSNKQSENLIKLDININKDKSVKEKNIKNQVTKYELRIDVKILFENLLNGKKGQFDLTNSGSYDVATRYSETLNNEKTLINLLINDLSEDIFANLTKNLNDL